MTVFSLHGLDLMIDTRWSNTIIAIKETDPAASSSIFKLFDNFNATKYALYEPGFLRWMGAVFASEISKHANVAGPIYIVGHSAGAAVGLNLIRPLSLHGYTIEKWVGLGMPRTGWKDAYNFIPRQNSPLRQSPSIVMNHYRYGADLVTYLPPWGNDYKRPYPVGESRIGLASAPWPNLKDHQIDKYLFELAALAKPTMPPVDR